MSFSGKDEHNSSFSSRNGNVVVSPADLSTNRTAYKYDTECTICHTSSWTIFTPKKYCKFCYRCVCKNCSINRVFHPDRKKQERCCSACFDRFISQEVLDDVQREIVVSDNKVKEVTSLLEEEKDRRSIHGATQSGLRITIKKVSEELITEGEETKLAQLRQDEILRKLESEVASLSSTLPVRKEKLLQAKQKRENILEKLNDLSSEAKAEREKFDLVKERLSKSQDEFLRLRRMLESRNMGSSLEVQKPRNSKKGKNAELQALSEELKLQQESLRKQNEEIMGQIKQLKDAAIPRSQTAISERELSHVGTLPSNALFSHYLDLQYEVERLKRELEKAEYGGNTEYRESEIEQLRRVLNKVQEENEDIRVQMANYREPRNTHRSGKCIIS